MKQFDCQNMPDNVREVFFDITDWANNDTWVDFYVEIQEDDDDNNTVVKWLIDEGAKENSKVLIKHWW